MPSISANQHSEIVCDKKWQVLNIPVIFLSYMQLTGMPCFVALHNNYSHLFTSSKSFRRNFSHNGRSVSSRSGERRRTKRRRRRRRRRSREIHPYRLTDLWIFLAENNYSLSNYHLFTQSLFTRNFKVFICEEATINCRIATKLEDVILLLAFITLVLGSWERNDYCYEALILEVFVFKILGFSSLKFLKVFMIFKAPQCVVWNGILCVLQLSAHLFLQKCNQKS